MFPEQRTITRPALLWEHIKLRDKDSVIEVNGVLVQDRAEAIRASLRHPEGVVGNPCGSGPARFAPRRPPTAATTKKRRSAISWQRPLGAPGDATGCAIPTAPIALRNASMFRECLGKWETALALAKRTMSKRLKRARRKLGLL